MVKKKISELTFDPLDLYKLGISKKELEKNIRLFQLHDSYTPLVTKAFLSLRYTKSNTKSPLLLSKIIKEVYHLQLC